MITHQTVERLTLSIALWAAITADVMSFIAPDGQVILWVFIAACCATISFVSGRLL